MNKDSNNTIPSDQKAREQIFTDLDHNFLVEASAGSGKTSSLVGRMVALVQSGKYSIDQVAAITFTRKAAIEMKERFQKKIEEVFLQCKDTREREILRRTLSDIEQCYIGTIHSFCARILREFPIEAGLDPGFKEMDEIDNTLFMEKAWEKYLSNLKISDSEILRNLEYSGIEIKDLKGCYKQVCLYPDIQIKFQQTSNPNLVKAWEELISFCKKAVYYIPKPETERGYDKTQEAILLVLRLKDYPSFVEKDFNKIRLLENFNKNFSSSGQITLNRWKSKEIAKEYKDITLPELRDKYIEPAIREWREYCHYHVFQFIMPAVEYYHKFREKYSMLNFQDLLIKVAILLRDYPDIRHYFQQKYHSILVDEFQDTDPIQAEIVFYLTGSDIMEKNWQKLVPRPGSLFIVGDPQQSIYHFRRADIAVYNQVKSLIKKSKGKIIQLYSNFRSLNSIEEYLNPVFRDLFSVQADEFQAQYSPMEAIRKDQEGFLSGVYQLIITKDRLKDKTMENDARAIAGLIQNWISQKVKIVRREDELDRGLTPEVNYSDFMILLRYKKGMDIYARVLADYGIPVTVSGSASINQSRGIRELLKLLRLLRDAENQVLLVAVLRGIFYGFSDDELYQFKETGGVFDFSSEIPDTVSPVLREKFQKVFEQLKCYYSWCRKLLPVHALEKIMTASGLQLSACMESELIIRENELYFLLEYLRKMEMDRFYTYAGMVEEIERLWESGVEEEFDLKAESNTVRIMNLHKAKGLEAPIVFLAIPYNTSKHEPDWHVQRWSVIPRGHFMVKKSNDYGNGKIIAQPNQWEKYCQTETLYLQAEETRLLYVAATRAKNLLVISSLGKGDSQNKYNPWKPLLKKMKEDMVLSIPEMQEKKEEGIREVYSLEEYKNQKQDIINIYQEALVPDYIEKTPSELKSSSFDQTGFVPTIDKGGTNWGKAVHEVLEYLLNSQPSEEFLFSYIVYTLEKNDLPVYRKDELFQLIKSFRESQLYSRIMQSGKVLTEVPVNLKITAEKPLYEQLIENQEEEKNKPVPIILNGTIDLAFRESDGWVIVDYKTDCPKYKADYFRLEQIYQNQINRYVDIWQNISKETVKEKIIYFTSRLSGE
ncbi:MAG: UvrD-helicase domain-containing protein [Elusimicrobiota bacterium]